MTHDSRATHHATTHTILWRILQPPSNIRVPIRCLADSRQCSAHGSHRMSNHNSHTNAPAPPESQPQTVARIHANPSGTLIEPTHELHALSIQGDTWPKSQDSALQPTSSTLGSKHMHDDESDLGSRLKTGSAPASEDDETPFTTSFPTGHTAPQAAPPAKRPRLRRTDDEHHYLGLRAQAPGCCELLDMVYVPTDDDNM